MASRSGRLVFSIPDPASPPMISVPLDAACDDPLPAFRRKSGASVQSKRIASVDPPFHGAVRLCSLLFPAPFDQFSCSGSLVHPAEACSATLHTVGASVVAARLLRPADSCSPALYYELYELPTMARGRTMVEARFVCGILWCSAYRQWTLSAGAMAARCTDNGHSLFLRCGTEAFLTENSSVMRTAVTRMLWGALLRDC